MGQKYAYPTRWKTNIVAIIHMYGDRAIFMLFNDNQDIKYESPDI